MNWSKASVAFLITAITLVACGKNSESSPEIQSRTFLRTVFVKGDPINLVAGSSFEKESFISIDSLSDLNEYTLASIYQFTEKEVLVEAEDVERSIESGNEAAKEDETKFKKSFYKFKKDGNEYLYSSESEKIDLSFKQNAGKMDLISLQTPSGTYDLKAIHYSQKQTKDAFSILAITSVNEIGRVLLSFTFVKKSNQQPIGKASSNFKYLYGPGVKVIWDQAEELQINICGAQSAALDGIYRKGISQWSTTLNGRLKIKTKTLLYYPPFNDLNTHCIYTVRNYQTEYSRKIMNPGSTMSIADTFQGKFIDSDVMIWVKENEKGGYILEERASLQKTIAHEVGHLLGMDHQFDKLTSSIMGYSGVASITNYDNEAIASLYPLI
ncbi:MAG: matrixin family metalloprotease [Bacteriovorax sp.]|jgi:hypothetical protein